MLFSNTFCLISSICTVILMLNYPWGKGIKNAKKMPPQYFHSKSNRSFFFPFIHYRPMHIVVLKRNTAFIAHAF